MTETALSLEHSKLNTPPPILVGIGASAGGLEALLSFVANLPIDAAMTYIIALHMPPEHPSKITEVLSHQTKLNIYEASEQLELQANTIYIAPSHTDLAIQNRRFVIRQSLSHLTPTPSIDHLFSSIAEQAGERCIGIILSGSGTDGAHGIRAIGSVGGLTIAQTPETAKFDTMPRAAIRVGADLILAPADIALRLADIAIRPKLAMQENGDPPCDETDKLTHILHQIYEATRMDFSSYKESTITRQIERRMSVLQINNLCCYQDYVTKHPQELHALASYFLICVTSFFRDPDAFNSLIPELRKLLDKKRPGDYIRIWVPGCATGEEAYSIAIVLAEMLGSKLEAYRIQIFATDINPEATAFGRKGLYPESSVEDMDEKTRDKYFERRDRLYQINRQIRDMVVFSNQDLLQDPPFVRLDLLSCRNVLIYFKALLQEKIFRIFHYALNNNGLLFLGKSETVNQQEFMFTDVNRNAKIFRATGSQSSRIGLFGNMSSRLTPIVPHTHESNSKPEISVKELLLDTYAPPSILVAPEGNVLECFGQVAPFLVMKPGKVNLQLESLIHPELRAELNAIVQKVARSNEICHTHSVRIPIDGEERTVRAAVRGLSEGPGKSDFVVVSFEVLPELGLRNSKQPETLDEFAQARINELEQELAATRESLQRVIEELENSNEELQSLNEEAQSINEELQASNEELQSLNEEAQANNEELIAVNDELSLRSQELAEAIDDLENIQNSAQRAILLVDQDLNLRKYNLLARRFFGIESAQPPQNLTSIAILFNSNDLLNKIRLVSNSGKAHSEDFKFDQQDYCLHLYPYVAGRSGKIGGVVIAIDDITSRKQAQKQLELYQLMIERSVVPAFMLDIEDGFRLVYVNKAAEQHWGMPREELLQTRVPDWDPNFTPDQLQQFVAQIKQQPTQSLESTHKLKNGQLVPVEISLNYLDLDGHEYTFGYFKNISQRKAAEHERNQLLKIIECSLDFIGTADLNGNLLYHNTAARQMVGLTELADLSRMAIADMHPAWATKLVMEEGLPTVFKQGYWQAETALLHRDGYEIPVSQLLMLHRDKDGNPEFFSTIMRDIRPQKQVAASLKQVKVAEDATRAKSSFLATMSHEIRTPMNGIIGMTELALDTPLSDVQRDYLETVHSSAHSLLSIINDILDFSKIEAGQMSIDNISFDLNAALESVFRTFIIQAQKKGLELNYQVSDDLPDFIFADPARLRQVILNLMSNALKFTEQGKVELHATLRRHENNSEQILISISDTGIGIPIERHNDLFSPFMQVDGSIARRFGGTGLGLAISRHLVEAMGGRIWLEQKDGPGCTFCFSLPVKAVTLPREYIQTLNLLKDLRILLDIKDANEYDWLIRRLDKWQILHIQTNSSNTTLDSLKQAAQTHRPFDLLILDEQDGRETSDTLAQIRQEPSLANTPVILLSNANHFSSNKLSTEFKVQKVLFKPLSTNLLLKAIQSSLLQPKKPTVFVAQKPLHILLVEDNKTNQILASTMLSKWRHHVTIANHGQEALDILNTQSFDLILMDMQMPIMDGMEATRHIRAREQQQGIHVPIIAITANAGDDDKKQCFAVGMDNYIAKPINFPELFELIEKITHK